MAQDLGTYISGRLFRLFNYEARVENQYATEKVANRNSGLNGEGI